MEKFEIGKSAKDLANSLDMKLGDRDRILFENKYNYKFSDNEIAIKGRNLVVEQGNIRIRMLKADDLKNFVTGYDTCCCQRWDDTESYTSGGNDMKLRVLPHPSSNHNAGGSCVYKLTSDPFAANVVIEKNGEVVGQSFVWTDELNKTFVFDNIEWANDGNIQPYLNIIGVYVKNLPYPNVQLGMGCTQGMNGVGEPCKIGVTMPTTLSNRHIYSDYHPNGGAQARDLKRYNEKTGISSMIKYPINEDICHVTYGEDEPTKWDILTQPQFSFMLNDYTKTIEDRKRLAEEFLSNPTKAMQAEIFSHTPEAILTTPNPDPDLQVDMYVKHPEIAKRIPSPCPALQAAIIADNPEYLRQMDNPSEETILQVMRKNGLLLDCVQNKTEAICLEAVKNNGYAIHFVPDEMKTEEIITAAVLKNSKIVTFIDNPTPEMQLLAVQHDPSVVVLLKEPTIRAQMAAVARQPDIIYKIKNPAEPVVRVAVQKNPMIITKYQYKYPELRKQAIEQNGFVIRELQNVSQEEYDIAIRQNPNVARFVSNPQIREEEERDR